jgi:hypothetical protein
MKIMARNSSATTRGEKSTLRGKESDNINSTPKSHIIEASLKRRARLLITKGSIPRQTRSMIRYALDIRDPYLAQIVRRVEAGEMTIDSIYLEQT